MVNQNDLLPLERWLYKNRNKKIKFPNHNNDYFNRYINIKNWLQDNIYKHIGAATSAEDGGIYTDHGPDHFNAVIEYAGKILGINDSKNDISIDPYEVFLLLTAILLHDAGNVHGRKDHEKKPLAILTEMGKLAVDDVFEKKIIADIAEVHGGKTKNGDDDTIGNKKWKDRREYGGVSYRPNMIAALVRFADEICENQNRSAKHLIETDSLPKPSEVFHLYAYSIKNVSVDRQDKSIKLEFYIEKKNVFKKFGKLDKEVYLIDEVMARLEKMNSERIYCSRYMYEVIQLRQIKASVFIVDEHFNELKSIELKLEDKGYPSHVNTLAEYYPDWTGEKLKDAFIES